MALSAGRLFVVAALAGVALLTTPLAASATSFGINIIGPGVYGGGGITVFDNGPGDLNPALNQITIQAGSGGLPAIPGFGASIDVALTNAPGGPASSLLDTTYTLSSVGMAGGAVQITTSANGYMFPAAGTPSVLDSSLGGTLRPGTGSVTGQQWVNLNNMFFQGGTVTGVTPGAQGPFGPGSFSNDATVNFTSSTPFSITDRLNLSLGADSLTTGDLTSNASVPEPATLLLLGSGLSGLGVLARRCRYGLGHFRA